MTEQRPWLAQYPAGIPANIDPTVYPALKDLLQEACKKFGTRTAFVSMGVRMTYRELDRRSTAFGAYLHYRGLQPGDRVALMMPNLLQYPIALHGLLKAGLVIVNTNPLYTPREMKHQFTDAGVKAIVIAENFASKLEEILPDTEIKTIVTTSIGELLGTIKGGITNFVVRNIKSMVPKFNLPEAVTFQKALDQGKGFTLPEFKAGPDDLAALQYTGGTTGVSKGAMLTNRNLVANALQAKAWMATRLEEAQEGAMLCPLPLYHVFAFTVNSVGLFAHGITNVLVVNPRDLPKLVGEFKDNKIIGMTGVNTLFNALVNNAGFQKLDFTYFELAVGGGMAVQRPVAEAWQKITGGPLSEGYGLTEASPVTHMNPLDATQRLGTIGLPMSSTDARVWNTDEDRLATQDERGELQIKGPQVMKGYYNRPDETAKTITPDGWLKTGDVAVMSEDGFFKIVDRMKDMILVSGFNVYPNEVEDVMVGHPGVVECAAVGIPSEKSGEVVKLFVVPAEKGVKEAELIAYAKENLTGYKVPKAIEFRNELPKSNVGKILRRHLREPAEG